MEKPPFASKSNATISFGGLVEALYEEIYVDTEDLEEVPMEYRIAIAFKALCPQMERESFLPLAVRICGETKEAERQLSLEEFEQLIKSAFRFYKPSMSSLN